MANVRRLEGITRALIERLGMDDDHFTERGTRLARSTQHAHIRVSDLLERTPETQPDYATLSDLDQQLGLIVGAYETRMKYAGQVSVNRKFHRMLRDIAQRTVLFSVQAFESHSDLQEEMRGREKEISDNHDFLEAIMSTYQAARDAFTGGRYDAAYSHAKSVLEIANKLRWDYKVHALALGKAKDTLECHEIQLFQLSEEQRRGKDGVPDRIEHIERTRADAEREVTRLTPLVKAKKMYADLSHWYLDDLKNSNLL